MAMDKDCYVPLDQADQARTPLFSLFKQVAPIGFLSFGGTQANMALFYSIFVNQRGWLKDEMFGDILAMAQSLPGPSACQVLLTASSVSTQTFLGGIMSFLFFSIPTALVFAWLGVHISQVPDVKAPPVLSCAAIAIVASGALQLKTKLVKDKVTETVWLFAAITAIFSCSLPDISAFATLGALVFGGAVTLGFGPPQDKTAAAEMKFEQRSVSAGISKPVGGTIFILAWIGCAVTMFFPENPVAIFYRSGSLVFGGGPVVIPLLLMHLVGCHLITTHQFLLGFAISNVFPGPMFNLAAFLGGLMSGSYLGAWNAWLALFAPGLLMQFGALPFWASFRNNVKVRQALTGINAAAAGLMAAAVVILWVTIVTSLHRAGVTVAFIGARQIANVPSYGVVLVGAMISTAFYFLQISF